MTTEQVLESMETDSQIPGLINIMRKEFSGERTTRFWIVQILVWLLLVAGIPALLLAIPPNIWIEAGIGATEGLSQGEVSILIFFALGGTMAILFIPVLMQGEIVDELESGTAAWIISKPVSRTAFIVAKFIANTILFTIVVVVIPGLVGALMFASAGMLTPIGYLSGLGLSALVLIWFLFLTITLGVTTKSRSKTMGFAIGLYFVGMFVGQMILPLTFFLPVLLPLFITPFVAAGNLGANPLPPEAASMIPLMIVVPIIEIFLFVIISVWAFRRIEL